MLGTCNSESVCWQSVEGDSKEHAADVRKECTCDRTSTDLLQDAQVVLEMGSNRGVPSKN